MGRVYLAHDPEIDRPVAIKTIEAFEALPPARQAEARAQFMAEARAAGKLLHPGIVTLFDAGESAGTMYLAMEYVEGDTLDRFTVDPLLDVPVAVEMVAAAAEALDYAHRAGVVHRDIKPANLMRVGDTSVKIMDFGLAGPMEAQLTADGSLLGTPAYMSPEQVRDRPVDGRSDLFSLGVVLYELLTGYRPFAGESVSSIVYRIVHEPAVEIEHDHPRVSQALREFIDKAIRKHPAERFTDGAHFASALRATLGAGVPSAVEALGALGAQSAQAQPPEPPAYVPPPVEPAPVPEPRIEPPTSEPQAPPPVAMTTHEEPTQANADPTRFESGPTPRARHRARRRGRGRGGGGLPRSIPILLVLGLAGAAAWYYRDAIKELMEPAPPPVVVLETRVRTEPPGLEVQLDGVPIDAAGIVRFDATGPFGTLSASRECRTAEHVLDPADGGGEVVLLLDETRMQATIDPGEPGAAVEVNGKSVGTTPAEVELDLCKDNLIRVVKSGFNPTETTVAAGALPLATRTQLAGIALSKIPQGKLRFPSQTDVKLVWSVDAKRVPDGQRDIDLLAGEHVVRARNDYHFIDMQDRVTVAGDTTVDAPIGVPEMTDLVVQAFPPNCKVYVRRPGGRWRYVDDTPFRRKVAVGDFEVRVQLNPTGESQERKVTLVPGDNPPIRVSFRGQR